MSAPDTQSVMFNINAAWSMLANSHLDFELVIGNVKPNFSGFHFAIPIKFSDQDPLGAVALEISRSHAFAVSSFLYQINEEGVTEDIVNDVCSEICNVLSSCVCSSFSSLKDGCLNLPQKLSPNDFAAIFNASRLDKYFRAKDQSGEVIIYLFDPCVFLDHE